MKKKLEIENRVRYVEEQMVEMESAIMFLVIGTITDLKERKVSVWISGCFGIAGGLWGIIGRSHTPKELFFGGVLGLSFMGISALSKGKIGMGDGLVIMVLGILLGGFETFHIVLWGFLMSAVFSLVAIIALHKKGEEQFPFIPFLLMGTVAEICCR